MNYIWDGALCLELAENVQKVTLVGSFNFGSSWHPFEGLHSKFINELWQPITSEYHQIIEK